MEIEELYTTDNTLLDEEIISEENLEVSPEPESVSSVNNENLTPAPSNTIITQYFNLASYDAYREYEHIWKKIGYIALITLCVFVAIGYVYSKPGTGMRLKWRRSVRKLVSINQLYCRNFDLSYLMVVIFYIYS